MKSITIHGLEGPLIRLIREKAREEGISLNKAVKKLLEESLGLKPTKEEDRRNEFMDLFGIWNQEDARAFNHSIEDLEKIDPEDWA